MLLLLIACILLGLALLAYILYRARRIDQANDIHPLLRQFNLSPLEGSILRDIYLKDKTASSDVMLYELFCKNIRDDLQRQLAVYLTPRFDPASMIGEHLQAFFREEEERAMEARRSIEARRRAERNRARAPAPPALPRREEGRQSVTYASPPPLPRRPDDFHILDYITQHEIDQQIRVLTEIERRLKPKHVYNSSQNVHIVNKGALDSAKKIIRDFLDKVSPDIEDEVQMLLRNAPADKSKAIGDAVETLNTSLSRYGYTTTFTLKELFHCSLMCIKQASGDLQLELTHRLYEELAAMSKQCGTGHLVRLVNVFQGFYDQYALTLPIDSEIYARLSLLIQKDIEESPEVDEILLDPEVMKTFLKSKHADYADAMWAEYSTISTRGEVEKAVKLALNKYTKTDAFG